MKSETKIPSKDLREKLEKNVESKESSSNDQESPVKYLLDLVKKFDNDNAMLKVQLDPEFDIISIFGEKVSALGRAKQGLEGVSELACATAEHHPYWSLLYQCSQISKILLEGWNSDLSNDELDEIKWCIKELQNMTEKLGEKNQVSD